MMMELPGLPEDQETQELEMRRLRDELLASSDWTQLPDAPVNTEAWATYRQALRDAPATWTPGPTWDAPTPPG